MYYVYALLIDNDIFYIGKASMKHRRFDAHMSHARKGTATRTYRKMAKAIAEGKTITMSPLHINLTEEQAFDLERQLIVKYGRLDLGTGVLTNHTDGGEGNSGYKHSKEARNKISEAGRARPKKFGYRGGGRPAHKIKVIKQDGTPIKTFDSLADLQRETGKSKNALYSAFKTGGMTKLWDQKTRIIALAQEAPRR